MFAPSVALTCSVVVVVNFWSLAFLFLSFLFVWYHCLDLWVFPCLLCTTVNDVRQGRGEVSLKMLILVQERNHGEGMYMCVPEPTLLWKISTTLTNLGSCTVFGCVVWRWQNSAQLLVLILCLLVSGTCCWQATSTVKLKEKIINSVFASLAAQDSLGGMFEQVTGPLYPLCTGILNCSLAENSGELICSQTSTK